MNVVTTVLAVILATIVVAVLREFWLMGRVLKRLRKTGRLIDEMGEAMGTPRFLVLSEEVAALHGECDVIFERSLIVRALIDREED